MDLVEKRGGIFKVLDEECVFPKGSDKTFKEKLDNMCGRNQFYQKNNDPETCKGEGKMSELSVAV